MGGIKVGRKVRRFIIRRFSTISWVALSCLALGALSFLYLFLYFTSDLPDYDQLAAYDPTTITRLYSNDGNVVAEYAQERRIFAPYQDIPQVVINAFLAAEDKNFFDHSGVDLLSIVRAGLQSIINISANKRVVGASTITQQVARDFLLTNERTMGRKIKEAVLAYRITKAYSKERILELYLNQIFLGNKSYGIAAAAHNYFNKELVDLDVAEAAMLAALPKAPTDINPYNNYNRAKARRDWVIDRMREGGFISEKEARRAADSSITLNERSDNDKKFDDSFYSEAVRRDLIKLYGEDVVYKRGLIVNINISEKLQQYADDAFRKGVIAYDRKHGWRGAIGKVKLTKDNWHEMLLSFIENDSTRATSESNYVIAAVIAIKPKEAEVGLVDGSTGVIKLEKMLWARKTLPEQAVGPVPQKVTDVVNIGDIILVNRPEGEASYNLEQIPEVNGAMVVLQPYTGRILAMVGGYSITNNFFNRAIQAKRQPGSAFKTFVYLTAFENGYSPYTILIDEPMAISQGQGMPMWTPKNYKNDYMGAISLNTAFAKSRNLPTVKLIMSLGVPKVLDTASRLGVYKQFQKIKPTYSMALGAFETTLLDIGNAYNIIASGGFETRPKLIDSIYDRYGELLYRDKDIVCDGCDNWIDPDSQDESALPSVQYFRAKLIRGSHNKQMVALLREAIENGTGARAKVLGRDIGGKTGTTNNSFDNWFIGFSNDFTVAIYLGFDAPRTLGQRETGGTSALLIFVDFMKNALKGLPNMPIASQRKVIDMVNISGIEDGSESDDVQIPTYQAEINGYSGNYGEDGGKIGVIDGTKLPESTVQDLNQILMNMKNEESR